MSASEQGLQALQLYSIKSGARAKGRSSFSSSSDHLLGSGDSSLETSARSSRQSLTQSSERLLERLEEQAKEAGLQLNPVQAPVNSNEDDMAVHDTSRLADYEFGDGPVIESMDNRNLLGEVLSAGVDKIVEKGTIKINQCQNYFTAF